MADRKFATRFEFTATVEGDTPADALANAGIKLNYGFDGARNISVRVMSEIHNRAIKEAPYADQVTVHESDGEVEQPPAPTITLLAPDEPSTREVPVVPRPAWIPTEPAVPGAALTAAYAKPAADDIPF